MCVCEHACMHARACVYCILLLPHFHHVRKRRVKESKGPNCMDNESVPGGLLILRRASWGESLSMRMLPLIIHKACRRKVCTGTQQMVIKSCVLFYCRFYIPARSVCLYCCHLGRLPWSFQTCRSFLWVNVNRHDGKTLHTSISTLLPHYTLSFTEHAWA